MLPLKLVRSLVLGETISNPPLLLSHHHHHNHEDNTSSDNNNNTGTTKSRTKTKTKIKTKSTKTPLLLFLPTKEVVTDTYRLATIARSMGMDLYPTPSLSHVIFACPSSLASSSTSPSTPCTSSSASLSWSSTSSLLYLPNNSIPLPFPSLCSSSITHLRSFVSLSKGLFKLVFINSNLSKKVIGGFESDNLCNSHWDCCSLSLFWRLNGCSIDSMDKFSRALAGVGWTLYKTKKNSTSIDGIGSSKMVYLFRKVDSKPVYLSERNGGECRIRELKLPALDFKNTPLRILHYILLMTDDVFYLA